RWPDAGDRVPRRSARRVLVARALAAPRHVYGHRQPARLSRRAADVHRAARRGACTHSSDLRGADMTSSNETGATLVVMLGERRFEFAASDLPVTIGGDPSADVELDGVPGAVQIGRLGDVFFVQAGRATRNVRIDGRPLAGTAELGEGSVVALDRARLKCSLRGGELTVAVTVQVTAADTAPPDIDELARSTAAAPLDVAITPVAFDPNASAALGRKRRGI